MINSRFYSLNKQAWCELTIKSWHPQHWGKWWSPTELRPLSSSSLHLLLRTEESMVHLSLLFGRVWSLFPESTKGFRICALAVDVVHDVWVFHRDILLYDVYIFYFFTSLLCPHKLFTVCSQSLFINCSFTFCGRHVWKSRRNKKLVVAKDISLYRILKYSMRKQKTKML